MSVSCTGNKVFRSYRNRKQIISCFVTITLPSYWSADMAAVFWRRLNNDHLYTLLSLSVVHWPLALLQHSLHNDLATLISLTSSWHSCRNRMSPHWQWCSSCSLMSLIFNNISTVPQWTRPHSLQTHSCLLRLHTVSGTATICIFMSVSCESNYCYSTSHSNAEFYPSMVL